MLKKHARLAASVMAGLAIACARAWARPAGDDARLARGAYLAQLADCAACHTAEGGKPMAGGLAFETPGGTVYSTEYHPRPQDRRRLLYARPIQPRAAPRRRGGRPFPLSRHALSVLRQDDGRGRRGALRLFHEGVAPVEQANKPAEMRFPFNIRASMFFLEPGFPLTRSRSRPIRRRTPNGIAAPISSKAGRSRDLPHAARAGDAGKRL